MVMSQERKNYLYDYQKKKLKRVPLDLKLEDYDNLKSAAEQAGQTVNGYIKQAIAEKMEREAGEYPASFFMPSPEPQPDRSGRGNHAETCCSKLHGLSSLYFPRCIQPDLVLQRFGRSKGPIRLWYPVRG